MKKKINNSTQQSRKLLLCQQNWSLVKGKPQLATTFSKLQSIFRKPRHLKKLTHQPYTQKSQPNQVQQPECKQNWEPLPLEKRGERFRSNEARSRQHKISQNQCRKKKKVQVYANSISPRLSQSVPKYALVRFNHHQIISSLPGEVAEDTLPCFVTSRDRKHNYRENTMLHNNFVPFTQNNDLPLTARKCNRAMRKNYNTNAYYSCSLQGRPEKQNQDSIVTYPNIYILCDGHGEFGKQVSEFVSVKLLKYMLAYRQRQNMNKSLMEEVFQRVSQDLKTSEINTKFSGSTALVVYRTENTLMCANVGDCRAILRQNHQLVELSIDHKPDRAKQKQRIKRMGGRVQRSSNTQSGPMRVWNWQRDSPGLAVSRSYGDDYASTFGVICSPQIIQVELTNKCQFVVMGSDGFYQFWSSKNVMNYVMNLRRNFVDEKRICDILTAEAKAQWKQQCTDDISCILVFL